MTLKSFFIFSILNVLVTFKPYAQDNETQVAISLMDNEKVASVNIDQQEFIECIKALTESLSAEAAKLPSTQKLGAFIGFHPKGDATIQVYGSPALDAKTESQIMNTLKKTKLPHTKLVDFSLFISVNTQAVTDFSAFVDPEEKRMQEYDAAGLAGKIKLNREFAMEILPVLAAFETSVDDQFEGVKKFGALVKATSFKSAQNIAALTSQNKNYWRACLEMNPGNQLISATKIFMLVSQGEFDHARKYLEVIRIYSDPETAIDGYLEQLNYRLGLFDKQLNGMIEKGLAEHDKGDYQKAIGIYKNILKTYPASSWALYEKYFSENAERVSKNKVQAGDHSDWDKAKVEIYRHNPLYNMDVHAGNGREAWLIFRRAEINELFKNGENRKQDVFNYALIALDLGVYDFAAQLFWLSVSSDADRQEKALQYFLYCLDKMGEKELKSNFKGDFTEVFKDIDQERETEMKESSAYKMMKN